MTTCCGECDKETIQDALRAFRRGTQKRDAGGQLQENN